MLLALAMGFGVAMHAMKVASPGHIPYHNGLFIPRELQQVGWEPLGQTSVTQGIGRLHGSTIQLRNPNHLRHNPFPGFAFPYWADAL